MRILKSYYQWNLTIVKDYILYDVKDIASRKSKTYWKNRWTHWRMGSQGSEDMIVFNDVHVIALLEMMEYTRLGLSTMKLWPWIKVLCQYMIECSPLCVAIMEGFACLWEAGPSLQTLTLQDFWLRVIILSTLCLVSTDHSRKGLKNQNVDSQPSYRAVRRKGVKARGCDHRTELYSTWL